MDKTTNMVILETKKAMVDAISKSKLPAVVCSMILHEIVDDVDGQTSKIVADENKAYADFLDEPKEEVVAE